MKKNFNNTKLFKMFFLVLCLLIIYYIFHTPKMTKYAISSNKMKKEQIRKNKEKSKNFKL